jgi:uncharacterized protein (TIGR02646 family)
MRYVAKGAEPQKLRKWKTDNAASPQNLQYGNLPGEVSKQVRAALLREQGYLCAYTMRRLQSVADCHIEHVQPQNTAPGLDLDYANMAACFPRDGGDRSSGYGAPIKGGQPVTLNVNFVSPHQIGAADRFQYNGKGEISANRNDVAALGTISMLKLCHDQLVELRRRAIETHGLAVQRGTTRKAIKLKSAAEARRFAYEVLQPDANGQLEPFCVALAQVAIEYAAIEEARSQRLRAQHGGNY